MRQPESECSDWSFEAIGTTWSLLTDDALPDVIRDGVSRRIAAYDLAWSRFREDSLVSSLAREGGSVIFGDEAAPLFALYSDLFELTDGGVNPFVGRALEQLGYDAKYSFVPRGLREPVPTWDRTGWSGSTLTLSEPRLIDVGAAGKGQLVDLVSGLLQAHCVESFTVDASGDLFHHAHEPMRVGLENPKNPGRVLGVATIDSGSAICGSASNRRRWADGLHHILDGRTGRPTDDIMATWVIADSAMVADGLATALFVTEPSRLASRFEFECVRVHADGGVEYSEGFPGEWLL